jgi:hypothetical protein
VSAVEFDVERWKPLCICGQPRYNHSTYNDGTLRRIYCVGYQPVAFETLQLVEQPQRRS